MGGYSIRSYLCHPSYTKTRVVAEQNFFDRLKTRWGIGSNIQVILILIVFAINGSFAAWVASPITEALGLDKETTNGFVYWPLRILMVFPIYQITLPIVGFLFGQFKFFWGFTKKMIKPFNRLFGANKR